MLNIVANNMELANSFSEVKPQRNFQGYEEQEPQLFHSEKPKTS